MLFHNIFQIINKKNTVKAAVLIIALAIFMTVNSHETINAFAEETGETGSNSNEKKVELFESYKAEFGMYEESIDDVFFFYCNVANGAMTSDTVVFDIPKNISYVVELDGKAINYAAGKEIKANGNYVIRLSGQYNGTTYSSTFRFSKREAAKTEETTSTSENATTTTTTTTTTTSTTDEDLENITEEDLNNLTEEDISKEEINQMINNAGNEWAGSYGNTNNSDGYNVDKYTGLLQKFDKSLGMYVFTLKSGENITSNVPAGAIINGAVSIRTSSDITATVYKDGNLIEGLEYLDFKEEGTYCIRFSSTNPAFIRFYPEEKQYPVLSFRILGLAQRDLEIFTAPKGCKIVSIGNEAGLFKNPETDDFTFELDNYWIPESGYYKFGIYDPDADGTYYVEVTRDLEPPTVTVNATKSSASFTYPNADVAYVKVFRNGQNIEYTTGEIKGKGNYYVEFYDYAGNLTTTNFTLKDAFNSGDLMTIILVIILGLGTFVYLRLERTVMRVR